MLRDNNALLCCCTAFVPIIVTIQCHSDLELWDWWSDKYE